jgi:DNA sulfur modification protein DndD
MYIFKRLFKKDGFIEQIDIDDNFNVSLYINKLYGIFDIENMLENIGYVDMYKKLGRLFFKDLYSELNIEGYNELKHSLKNVTSMKLLNLRTKIDIESLSNGEKQIYILCLYWSLIKASGMDVPFIIDTPFARIDEIHRQNIVSEFFSTISSQVIILSTNTEIDQQSYKALKDIISKEYLIEYDDKARKTRKFDGYFYEV